MTTKESRKQAIRDAARIVRSDPTGFVSRREEGPEQHGVVFSAREQLLAELERLGKENARLRGLLGELRPFVPLTNPEGPHEDSDGRMDVLRCPVHGIGPEPWRDDPDGFRKRTREALRIARDAREAPR